ncbi:hypothetical protein G9A89_001729 [Geosiphon pyriformis]|nr:hypothetical protein G9A89_001729 [Geosiphon pyriformis]
MNYGYLFLVISQSSAQILLICIAGYVCARIGLINSTVQKGISELTVSFLMPCLLFSQVASEVDLETLVRLWPIPAFFSVYAIISYALGEFGGKALRLQKSQRNFVSAGIIFNNLTSISVGLIQSIEKTDVIDILLWGKDDKPSEAASRGISYTLLATLLANLLRWSLGTYLLRKQDEETHIKPLVDLEEHKAEYFTSNGKSSADETTPILRSQNAQSSKSSFHFLVKFMRKIMNPPLYAALIALVVGTTPQLKSLFFGPHAPFYPTITRAMIFIGDTAVPLTLLALGAQLNNQPRKEGRQTFSAVSLVMTGRFLIMPIIGISLVMLTRSWYIDDPMLWFALMLFASGPTAVNCVNITQFTGAFQDEMATLLFYSYITFALGLTFNVMGMFFMISKVK